MARREIERVIPSRGRPAQTGSVIAKRISLAIAAAVAAVVLAVPSHAQPAPAAGGPASAAAAPPPQPDSAAHGIKPAPADDEPADDEPNHLVLALAGIALLLFIVLRKGRRDD